MTVFVDVLDSIIHAIQLIARSIAFLLGIHLFIVVWFIRIFSEPAEANQRQRRITVPVSRLRVFTTHTRHLPSARHLHLPALEPRPYDEPIERSTAGLYKNLISHILYLGHKIKDQVSEMVDQVESNGGKSG